MVCGKSAPVTTMAAPVSNDLGDQLRQTLAVCDGFITPSLMLKDMYYKIVMPSPLSTTQLLREGSAAAYT